MNRVAYLVAFLKPDMTVGGVGIFSEEKPTCTQAGVLATIYTSQPMRDYGEARQDVVDYVVRFYPWLLPKIERLVTPPRFVSDAGSRPAPPPQDEERLRQLKLRRGRRTGPFGTTSWGGSRTT